MRSLFRATWTAFALTIAGGPAAAAAQSALAIQNVSVVDVEAGVVVEEVTVTVVEGVIEAVAVDAPTPPGATVIDGSGRFLIPGLWDMHAHMRSSAAPTLIMPQFIAHGVTGVRDMASECDREDSRCLSTMLRWRGEIDAGDLLGPRLLALSSYPLNPAWDAEVSEDETRALVRDLAERGADFIKAYFRLPPEALLWVIDEADRVNVSVGGHLPLSMTAAEASDLGLRSLEHARDFLFDCFPGSAAFRETARTQNPPMEVMRSMVEDHDEDLCAQTFAAFVTNDTWYVPTHVTRRMDAFADDPDFRQDPRAKYVPASGWASWQEDADRMVALDPSPAGRATVRGFYEKGLEITGRAHAAGVNIAMGTDAGDTYVFYGSGAHDELGELVKAGLSPAEALAAATINGARFLGLEERYGSIKAGRAADVVLLRGNPLDDIEAVREIEAVILGGRLFDRTDLDEMLAEVESVVARFGPGLQ